MARSLNRVQLIGNLTRDPELRYTPNGTAVCSFSVATNRNWTTDAGEKKEEAEFHRVVAWNKLAEICSQFLVKGRKVFIEGRLSTKSWNAQDGTARSTTEIITSDMILLDSRRSEEDRAGDREAEDASEKDKSQEKEDLKDKNSSPVKASGGKKEGRAKSEKKESGESEEEISPDDIPF